MDTRYEKVLIYGLYILAFITPWITWERWVFTHATSKVFLFYGGVLFLGAFWVYALIVDRRYRLDRKEWYMMAPLFVYVLWMIVTTITARNSGLAIWGSLMRGTGLMTLAMITVHATMLVSLAKRYGGFIATYLKWVVAGGAVVVASVWLGDEGINIPINVLQKASGGGVTGNSTLAGAYLIFILGFILFLIAIERSKRSRWLWVLVTGIVLSPVFLSLYGMFAGNGVLGSARAALGAIVVGVGVGALVYLTQSTKKALRTAGWAGVVAGVGMFVVIWQQVITPGTSLHNKFIELASRTRFAFWDISQKVLKERPFLGYGPENFPIAQARYFDPQFLSRSLAFEAWTDQPHNVYYNNAIAGGYPGILFYILFVGALIVGTYRNTNLNATQKSILIGTLVAYLVQDLVSFDGFITIYILGIYAAIVYGSKVTSHNENVSQKHIPKHQYIFAILLAVAIFGIYMFAYQPAQKAKLFGEVLGSKLNERYPRYQEFLKGSPVGNYWDVSGFAYDEYKLYVANPLAIKQDEKLLPHAINDVDAYITYLEQLTQTNKTDYRLYFTLVNFYNTKIFLSDIPYDASLAQHIRGYIDYAQILAPTDPRIYWLYAQLAAWKGDIPAVISAYQSGIAIDPTLPVSHKLLLQFLRGIGAEKLYGQALQYAQSTIPEFTLN